MTEIQAPNSTSTAAKKWDPIIFLAGSIEMGQAENWQQKIISHFKNDPVTFLNPRRNDWNSNWIQSKDNPEFKTQVFWELDGLEFDLVVFYFEPNTISPITLLELGIVLARGQRCIICCPDGYFRQGNVELTAEYFKKSTIKTFEELLREINNEVYPPEK